MDYLQKYGYTPNEEELAARIQAVAANLDGLATPEVLKRCFSLMDLTTLKTNDTEASVSKLVDKTNRLVKEYPDYPLPASICVYPNFASVVRERRCSPDLHVTTVSGCFPSSQSFLEVKVQECVLAVRGGADEVDIVLALNAFLAEDYEAASREIVEMKKAIDAEAARQGRRVVLKVILETGLLVTPERIARASFLAMEAGADFIKTSTGKVPRQGRRHRQCHAHRRIRDVRVHQSLLREDRYPGRLQGRRRHLQRQGRPALLLHRRFRARQGVDGQGPFPLRREPAGQQPDECD